MERGVEMRRTLSRLGRALAALALAATAAVVVAPGTAYAATCPEYHFCWYNFNYQGGARGTQYTYTNGFIPLNTLVNDSQSSWEKQRPDPICSLGYPIVFLKDVQSNTIKQHPAIYNYKIDSFFSYNDWRMHNKFDQIRNFCR